MNQLSISGDLATRERERSIARARVRRAAEPRRAGLELRVGRVLIAIDGHSATTEPLSLRGTW